MRPVPPPWWSHRFTALLPAAHAVLCSDEAQARFDEWLGTELQDREDWEEELPQVGRVRSCCGRHRGRD